MKQGRPSLSALAAEIERQADNRKDYIAPTTALTMTQAARLDIKGNGGELPINAIAHRQIAERLQIPARYYDRMLAESPQLLATNVNAWFQRSPDSRMVRTLDGEVRAFLSDRYQRIDNLDVMLSVLPVLKSTECRVVSSEVTGARLYIKAVTSAITAEVKSRRVGDLVEAGVMITNSEVGMGAISVRPFAHFLICTNGMVRDKASLRAAHVGRKQESDDISGLLSDSTKRLEDQAVLSKVKDVVTAAFDAQRFRQWIDSLEAATADRIEGDVPKAVEVLGEVHGLAQAEKSMILRNLIEGGDLSRYGLANAITRAAEDVESYDRATELETLGGTLIDLPRSSWREIATAA